MADLFIDNDDDANEPILIYPGEVGDMVELNDFLEERREDARQARQRDIDERLANKAPLDGLEPLEPYKRQRALNGVRVQFVVLEERQRRALAAKEGRALQALSRAFSMDDVRAELAAADIKEGTALHDLLRRALSNDDFDAKAKATDALFDARGELIAASAVAIEVRGKALDVSPQGIQRTLSILERSSLLTEVARAAALFQELGAGKASRSGSHAASTLGASNASSAPSTGALLAVVTAAHSSTDARPSSPARDGQPTPAPGGT